MGEFDLYTVRDGETLRRLENGLEIVRREKHEWRDGLLKLGPEQLARRTGKIWGSKFLPQWTLPLLVDWISTVVTEEGWILQPGVPMQADRILDDIVGLAAGNGTRIIRIVCDGRYVHAYPIAE